MISLGPGIRIANRYVLDQCIGRGGHAQIWTATDERDAKRVALKLLHPELYSSAQARDVLRHEAMMASWVDHPGVVRAGTLQQDGDLVFLPLEYAGGADLLMLRGASYLRIVPVLIEVADILNYAHQRGLVHRDVKPANVLVDDTGTVRLVDFGMAAVLGTAGGPAPGSPFTSSPQQLSGESAVVADDVYSLGAMAYELLSGYPPGYPEFDLGRARVQMPAMLRPRRPAPPRLVQLVMQMLARDPAQRPMDMRQVSEELRQALSDTLSNEMDAALLNETAPASSGGASPPRSALWRWLALVGVLLVAAGGWALW
jgi:serine/threonine protein kinase